MRVDQYSWPPNDHAFAKYLLSGFPTNGHFMCTGPFEFFFCQEPQHLNAGGLIKVGWFKWTPTVEASHAEGFLFQERGSFETDQEGPAVTMVGKHRKRGHLGLSSRGRCP